MDRYNKPQFESVDNSGISLKNSLPLSEAPESTNATITEIRRDPSNTVVIGDGTSFTTDLLYGDWMVFPANNIIGRVFKIVSDTKVILAERLPDGFTSTSDTYTVIPKNKADLRYMVVTRGEDEEAADFVKLIDRFGNGRPLADVYSDGINENARGASSRKLSPLFVEFGDTEANASAVSITADYSYIQDNG